MALIECPECKREISDAALACPNCGLPREARVTGPEEVASTRPVQGSREKPREQRGVIPWLFFALVVIALGRFEGVKSESEVASASPDEWVTAARLFADYEANEVAADEKYKGKVLVVTGTIEDIGKDFVDTMYVTLRTDNGIMSVQCRFDDEHKFQLANTTKGQQVTLKGKCDGKFGNVLLSDCSFR